jgi:SAM-dependent methyltransferase
MEEFEPFVTHGYCHCCRSEVDFEGRLWWLRDHFMCTRCGSIPRQRHLMHVLDRLLPDWTSREVHESSPSAPYLAQLCSAYSSSQWLPGVAMGAVVEGIRCENLEAMTFPDGAFDVFVTQDVMEHVFDPGRAASEVMRVLRPGGLHVFTAPKHAGLGLSRARARIDGAGQVEYLDEALYHGNPVGDGRALVTWDYGADFEHLLNEWSGYPVATYVTRDRGLGLDGEYLEVFVMRKH